MLLAGESVFSDLGLKPFVRDGAMQDLTVLDQLEGPVFLLDNFPDFRLRTGLLYRKRLPLQTLTRAGRPARV
jgi:hypothetical protein